MLTEIFKLELLLVAGSTWQDSPEEVAHRLDQLAIFSLSTWDKLLQLQTVTWLLLEKVMERPKLEELSVVLLLSLELMPRQALSLLLAASVHLVDQ